MLKEMCSAEHSNNAYRTKQSIWNYYTIFLLRNSQRHSEVAYLLLFSIPYQNKVSIKIKIPNYGYIHIWKYKGENVIFLKDYYI